MQCHTTRPHSLSSEHFIMETGGSLSSPTFLTGIRGKFTDSYVHIANVYEKTTEM